MKQAQKRRTGTVGGLSALLMGGMIAAGLTPAQAHTEERYSRDPAPGVVQVRDRDRDHRDWDRDRDRRYRDWDRDGIRNRRDWDRDGDGIPNWRDPHPNRPDRYRYSDTHRRRFYDRDRDGIRNRRDWDRDGDGTPNWRDRRPENPYRQ